MKQVTMYQGKRVLVIGLAKSGLAAAMLLHELGASVTVNDQKPLDENETAKQLHEKGIRVICGGHPLGLLDEPFDLVVKNPGIPYTNPMVAKALEKGLPIITEVELAYAICEAPFIGITGSNGKTTTTTLIYEMLKEACKKPLIAGNIGMVACEVAKTAHEDNWVVTELSSFQLMGIEAFRPRIAVLLNIFDAHLDYHGTKEAYAQAKGNLLKNQTESDYAVVNADDEWVMKLAEASSATKIFFSTTKPLNSGAYVKDQAVYWNSEKVIALSDIVLPGKHNLENILAAVAAAKLVGADNAAIARVLTTFTGVKHRLQYVGTVNGRKFFNDSKATNILATQKALSAFSDQRVILLAGGLDRGNEFDDLIPYLKQVQAVILFGQTAQKLERVAKQAGIETVYHVDNVEKAVPVAYEISKPGDIILLSPACASWDQYKTFEQRGDIFISAVHKLE
ncbi:UDP-N-acetylmuramoyl-L-alanine--D-glutamate ligase [Anoxybacillus rupiensis]|uniref:UDP-N-acetylmuramoylalanine--D-glutamate ligase n=1 Tax=Anoxybacteroides rupiense TaxID=311460 RepID=A0ABD5IR83_9BACL|nr:MULTISPECIES: UDP-N-acetylmuramoyl-L-alanine--D-glutamate ligase [Anoxybacillus]KXG10457.1 UDP-N-acetylmuramoylalanine--D-glutamate ligase [Anoxybacillus sp. P3H1B]MBB3906259.1 UDP-N-acetylmuramoylalanine--D-glutamate ligase [Anoxybacillus rupiensis]MBS2770757.1 UDP-N-acetylmuramoyl-L-alanine--D-glutamate ligase [Anoxybacillus rupiensis]MDE8563023.1 UDP-N-acetylmuramoyl-L-alanine--D-glutamate ligase [Anoxybacillus rupiensis]MED5050398.1 UDP-N-acetylmuramoyl-L-alanine--D-glutamate ligase [An